MGLAHAIAEEQAQLKAVMSDMRLQKVCFRAVKLSVKMQGCVVAPALASNIARRDK